MKLLNMFLIRSNFDIWIDNNLNDFQIGIGIMLLGIGFSLISKYLHKQYTNEGYRWFRPFRREEKTQSEDNIFIIMYTRTLLGIYVGFVIVLMGIAKILNYYGVINWF